MKKRFLLVMLVCCMAMNKGKWTIGTGLKQIVAGMGMGYIIMCMKKVLIVVFVFGLAFVGCDSGGGSDDPEPSFRGTFTMTNRILPRNGVVTVELDEISKPGDEALSGRLQDGNLVVELTGTYDPDFRTFAFSADGDDLRYAIYGLVNASGKAETVNATLLNKNDEYKADGFLVNKGGAAISRSSQPIAAMKSMAQAPGGNNDEIPPYFRGRWTGSFEDTTRKETDSGLFSKYSFDIYVSGTYKTTGITVITALNLTLAEIKQIADTDCYDGYRYETIFSYPAFWAEDRDERAVTFEGYLKKYFNSPDIPLERDYDGFTTTNDEIIWNTPDNPDALQYYIEAVATDALYIRIGANLANRDDWIKAIYEYFANDYETLNFRDTLGRKPVQRYFSTSLDPLNNKKFMWKLYMYDDGGGDGGRTEIATFENAKAAAITAYAGHNILEFNKGN